MPSPMVSMPSAGDETLVDLQRADREAVQVGQRRETGTEIVQLHLDATLAQALQDAQRMRAIVQQRHLGDLQAQPARIGTTGVEQAEQAITEFR
ncbi:hypothetical protein G6F63_014782 [Rhizopus arrhizus]|nr:hypothetical protein G6F63_014782 [Rhizopus arrhizus]